MTTQEHKEEYKEEYNQDYILTNLKKAANIHYIIRTECMGCLKPGMKYFDIVKNYEEEIKKYSSDNTGIAFPIGFSVNNICAHDSSYQSDNRVLKKGDILKVDIGVHSNGYIIDSATTHVIDTPFEQLDDNTQNLIKSTREATNIAIKNSGVDARIYEISELIYETITSYDGIQPIYALGGHNIKQYQIHAGKLILCKPHEIQKDMKMLEGEIYAVETFASNRTGNIKELKDNKDTITHYMQKINNKNTEKYMKGYDISNFIKKRNMLPFNIYWSIDNKNSLKIKKEINDLCRLNIVEAYPAYTDVDNTALTSQSEHTIFIKESNIEILSKFNDY